MPIPQLHSPTMTNRVSDPEHSGLLSSIPNVAIPLEIILRCGYGYECEDWRSHDDTDYYYRPPTTIVRLAFDTEMKMPQFADQLLRVFDQPKLEMRKFLRERKFADHELHSFEVRVDWETKGMNYTENGVTVVVEKYNDGSLGCEGLDLEENNTYLNLCLDALARRGGKGHLVATCTMRAPGFDTVDDASSSSSRSLADD